MATITGNGLLVGGIGDDTITADAGAFNDILIGHTGSDTLSGGDGDDILAPDGNYYLTYGYWYYYNYTEYYWASHDDGVADHVDGGGGFDRIALRFDNVTSDITADFSDPSVMQTIAGSTIVNVEQFQIVLGSGNDTVTLGLGNDVVLGENGNDTIDGGGGYDEIHGGNGDDELSAGTGGGYLNGGADNDTLNGGDGNDSLYGETGDDRLTGGAGEDWMDGGAGNDTAVLAGNQLDYTFEAYHGWARVTNISTGEVDYIRLAETIEFADGSVSAADIFTFTINGTDSSEGLYGSYVNDTINAGAGNDHLQGYEGDDILNGEAGNDNLHGDVGNDTLNGGHGFDSLRGGNGNDTLNGGDGDDWLDGGDGDDTIDGGDGVDRTYLEFYNSSGGVTYTLNDGPVSTYYGTKTLSNIEGADMHGSQYDDTLTGGSAHDYMDGREGNDTLNGAGGDDQLHGSYGDDTLNGGDGNDALYGGWDSAGNDTLNGDAGDDWLDGGFGNDTLNGGAGIDGTYLNFQNAASGVTYTFADGTVVDTYYGTKTLSGIEWASIQGSQFDDILTGGSGNDQLQGWYGDDTLNGGAGDDWLDGYFGTDTLDGGDGVDRTHLNFTNVSGGVTYTLNDGPIATYYGTKTLSNIEGADMHGSQYDDTLTGGSATDNMYGIGGNDVLSGLGGDDYIDGGHGDDTLDGGDGVDRTFLAFWNASAGVTYTLNDGPVSTYYGTKTLSNFEGADIYGSGYDDTFTGGSARDYIDGQGGNDVLNGLSGDDTLIGWHWGSSQLNGGAGDDTLHGNGYSTTAVHSAARSHYSVVQNDDGSVTITDLVGSEGSDTLWNISHVSFDGVTMTMADALDPPNSPPAAPTDSDGAAGATVAEDLAVGSAVGITASATDADGDTLTYYFRDGDGNAVQTIGHFTIDAATGVVMLASALDHETATSHALTVYAGDGTDESSSLFTVYVANVEEEATGTLGVTGTAEEGGSLAASLTEASDPDGAIADTAYQWQELLDGSWVDIPGASNATLNIPSDQSYVGKTVRVVATTTDALGGTTTFTSAAQTIANVNDAPDALADSDGAPGSTVGENFAVGSAVGITASGADADGDILSYFFKDGDGNAVQTLGCFTIDAATGVVTLAAALNYEMATSHALTIFASDGAEETSSAFTLNVTNAVEHLFDATGNGTIGSPIDFNALPDGAYDFDSARYTALSGDDFVILPDSATVDAGNPWDYAQAFDAGVGNDLIQGGDSNDIIAGGAGIDRLFGGAGNDNLNGGADTDILIGGAGSDRLTGSTGSDVFIFTASELGTSRIGPHDVITDFQQGSDLIDVSALYASHAVGAIKPGKATDAASLNGYKIAFYSEGGNTYVIGDTNGVAGADFTIELTGTIKLKASDFITSSSAWPAMSAGYDYASLHQDLFWV